MKTILFILILPLAAMLPGKELKAQVFDVKLPIFPDRPPELWQVKTKDAK